MLKSKNFLFLLGLIFVISIVYNIYQSFNKQKPNIITNTIVKEKIDTVYKTNKFIFPKLKAKIDTVFINNQKVQVASSDTLIGKDSNYVKVKYYFPPLNYFDAQFSLHTKYINKTDSIFVNKTEILPAKKTFFGNFHYSLQVGVGVGLINKQFDVYYGIGISYDLGNIF